MNLLNVFNSIVSTRGATYNIETGELNPDSGYIVALKGYEKTFDFDGNLNTFQDQIQTYLTSEIWDQIIDHWDIYIGFWVNEGKLYIDLVENIRNLPTAYEQAYERDQIAFWDCKEKRSRYMIPKVSNDPDIETDKKY